MSSRRVPLLLATVLFGAALCDPQILVLKNYLNGTTATVPNAEDGANLYLASNDPSDAVKNIMVTTGGSTHSLSEISGANPDGSSKSIAISGGLTITTTNSNSITNTLTGYLYITSAKQAQDATFSVYVITGTHHITVKGTTATTVVLNTQLLSPSDEVDRPQKSTYVTDIQQASNASLYFQYGIPPADFSSTVSNKFFENPLIVNNAQKFFTHFEPLQVGLEYWYFTTVGQVSMTLQNKYVNNIVYNTTAVETTGLLVNSNYLFSTHVINFQLDSTKKKTTGYMLSATIPRQTKVNFIFSDAAGSVSSKTYDNTNNQTEVIVTTDLAATSLTVNSTDITAGVFYCQYFGFNSDVIPSTSTPASSLAPGGSTLTSAPNRGSTVTPGTVPTLSSVITNSPTTVVSTMTPPTTVVNTVTAGAATTANTAPAVSVTTATVATTTSSARSLFMANLFLFVIVISSISV